jgi:hypothetical protein
VSIKKIFKIIAGIVIFITLPSLLFFGFLHLKYNEDLPTGKSGIEANNLATKMLNSLDYNAYKATDYIEWTFKNQHSYKWYKSTNSCEVFWDDFKVVLQLNKTSESKVFLANKAYNGIEKQKYISKAKDYFNNDSFWLVAPYKVFDKGVELRLVKTKSQKDALLVTYTIGGTTPGDSYLWHLDKNGRPISYQMWVDILPIGGLKATWSDWKLTETGANLPQSHKLLFIDLGITKIQTY